MKIMKIITSFQWLVCSLLLTTLLVNTVNAESLKEASWYVTMDIDQLMDNQLIKSIKGEELEAKIPKEISSITIYGNTKTLENATLVMTGDFDNFSLVDHVLQLLINNDEGGHHVEDSFIMHNQQRIDLLSIKDHGGDQVKKLYFAKVNDQKSVASLQLLEVKNWLDTVYDDADLNQGNLFSVVVDVESALAHMGMNIDESAHRMHSQIFKKVAQVSASVFEMNNNMVLEVGLTAKDEESAFLIEQVINGLLAMNNLSNVNDRSQLHAMFMQNLTIEKNGQNVVLNSYAPMDEIEKMELYKHFENETKNTINIFD